MVEASESDLQLGLGLLFGFVSILAAIGMAGTAFRAEFQGSEEMQMLSGVALAIALLAAGIAIVAIHRFD
jgi:hypothetical protein